MAAIRTSVLGIVALAGPLAAAPSFLSGDVCSLCHSRPGVLTHARVGHYETWRSSMMSAAARDPYWRARVQREANALPQTSSLIQDKCLRCHAAADQYGYRAAGRPMVLDNLTDTGREGVTCTVCHGIVSTGLGTRDSFTGGFGISEQPVQFGPHDRPFAMPMLHHTGYEPVPAAHIRDAALCGSCHTVLVRDSSGTGTFAEQATYLEWLASTYPAHGTTCQTCHVPAARTEDGKIVSDYIAHRPPGGAFPPTRPRSPVGVHTFIGGNVQMLGILSDAGSGTGFAERGRATREFLATAVDVEASSRLNKRELLIRVTVQNLTGHKLPTGLPGRRLWLRVRVRDSADRTIFESGAWDESTGELKYLSPSEPHRRFISSPEQTIIYEATIEDAQGRLTSLLTQGVRYRKDNRLLPAGFDLRAPALEALPASWVASRGTGGDSDFRAGSDTVEYRIPIATASPPYRTSVDVCFQSIRPADASALGDAFYRVYRRHSSPVIVTKAETTTGRR